MGDTPSPQSSRTSASKSWALLRGYSLVGAIVFVIVYAFANMPSQIGKSELPEPPIGSKSPPYFAVTTIALRDIPANTVLTSGDVGVGRVSIRNGIRHDLTIDSFDDPASVVGFRTKFKLYKNQEISKWDFCSPEFSSRRVVVCCADVSRGALLTRQNVCLGWVYDPKGHSRFGFDEFTALLGQRAATNLSRGTLIIDRDILPNAAFVQASSK